MLGEESRDRGGSLRRASVLAWLRLLRVSQKVERDLAGQLKLWSLNNAQFDVLAHVGVAEGITQQELADSLLVTKGNVCQLLDKMEASGLIERRPDGRLNRLFLTDQGRRVHDEVVPGHDEMLADRFNTLSAADQRELQRLIRQLDHALERA